MWEYHKDIVSSYLTIPLLLYITLPYLCVVITMKTIPTAISPEDFGKIIRHTKKKKFKIAFLLGFGSGLRLSEIVGSPKYKSKCCKADLEKKFIEDPIKKRKFRKFYCVNCKNEVNPKDTYASNEIDIEPLPPHRVNIPEKKILVEQGKYDIDRIVPLPKGFKEAHLKLLPLNKTYKNIKSARRAMERAFKVAAGKAGVLKKNPKLHFHSLRHGFGTHMANQGVPIHHIKTLMGHSNISTTNVYLESNPKLALESYEKLF